MRFAVAVGLVLALASGTASAVPQAIPAHHGRLSLPTAGKFAPLLHRRFVAKCRMDHCQWLRLDGSRLRSATGELYAVKQRWWHSGPHKTYKHAGPIKEASERGATGYVFCSKTKPAVIGTDGKTAYQAADRSRVCPRLCTSSIGRHVIDLRHLRPVTTQTLPDGSATMSSNHRARAR